MRLEGKVALISGGARGQGAIEVRLFAREGAKVVIGDLLEEEGQQVEAEINASGGACLFVKLDVTQAEDWQQAVAAAVARFGTLNVLVNNAGIGSTRGPDGEPVTMENLTEEQWDRVLTDRRQDTTTGGLPHVYKHRRATRRQVTLAYGEGDARPQLVITEHPGEPPDGDPIKLDQIGISHVSFTVPSVAQLTQQLLAKGYQTAGPPDAFQDQSGRVRTVFFFDPDGILVQFDESSEG